MTLDLQLKKTSTQGPETTRKRYTAPELKNYGSVRILTMSGGTTGSEGASGKKKR